MNITSPEKAGLSTARLKRLTCAMQAYIDNGEIPGVITLIARRGQIAHLEALGLMDVESQKAMQPDTIFRCYSMTKPVTATAILMLYEEGHFKLDDPVAPFIPAFRDVKVYVGEDESEMLLADLERDVTFRDLLVHTSGLVYDNPDGTPVERMVWARDEKTKVVKAPSGEVAFYEMTDEPLADWVARLLKVPLAHQPGQRWSYGYSYDVLGYLVEVISGMSLDRFFQERILDPLEMTDTTFHLPAEKIGRLSTMYCPKEGGGLTVLDSGPTSYWLPRKQFHSGGGDNGNALLSTVPDYYRFCQMLLNQGQLNGERILSRKTIELMTIDNMVKGVTVPDSPGLGAGLSVWVMQDPGKARIFSSKGSFGGGGYAGTVYWVDPTEELVALIAIQNACWSWEAQNIFPSLVYQAIAD